METNENHTPKDYKHGVNKKLIMRNVEWKKDIFW